MAEPQNKVEPQKRPRMRFPGNRPRIGGPVLAGAGVLGLFFLGLGGWAAFAPLESAAIAPGVVSVESNRQTIQHLEGGIVQEILARDGDNVLRGQVLLALDRTRTSADLEQLRGRQIALLAEDARLRSERDGLPDLTFSSVLDPADPATNEAMAGQEQIFAARRDVMARQTEILNQQAAQFDEEILGLQSDIRAAQSQLSSLAEEIRDVSTLVAQGLARRPRLLELERRSAEIEGLRGRNEASIARARQARNEAELRVVELQTRMTNETVTRLREVQSELFEINERLRAARDVDQRAEVRAPIAGTIVNSRVHTTGGVVAPGAPLMEIVPRDERRIIEARVDPSDIDRIYPGLKAEVRLTALPQRHLLPLEGEVLSVSADRLVDETTGIAYFLARVVLSGGEERLPQGFVLVPGMSAEVLILTGGQTVFTYITRPLMESFNRALRER